jgi:hypothetical protein
MTKMAKTNRVPDQQAVGLLKEVVFQPIFIIGDHRSGTTFLYELLDATQCFNVLTAYHVIRYTEILSNHVNQIEENAKKQLSDYFSKMSLTNRVIDGIKITPELPEEYGYLLSARPKPQLKPKNLPKFIELCKKVQFVSDPDKPLLLKNPWDCLNFMYVKKAFPECKFIFIHRNPINVINSQIKSLRSLLSSKNEYVALLADWYDQIFEKPFQRHMINFLFSSHFDLGLRIATRHVALATNYFLRNVRLLEKNDYISIKYEDLCEEPGPIVRKILKFLGLKENSNVEYKVFVKQRQTHLLDEVRKNRTSIRNRLELYFGCFGY